MESLLIQAIGKFFQILYYLILIRIILSWLPGLNNSSIGVLIHNFTEPILGPVRDMLDRSPIGGGMMLDFSPIIALFIMNIVCTLLQGIVAFIL